MGSIPRLGPGMCWNCWSRVYREHCGCTQRASDPTLNSSLTLEFSVVQMSLLILSLPWYYILRLRAATQGTSWSLPDEVRDAILDALNVETAVQGEEGITKRIKGLLLLPLSRGLQCHGSRRFDLSNPIARMVPVLTGSL